MLLFFFLLTSFISSLERERERRNACQEKRKRARENDRSIISFLLMANSYQAGPFGPWPLRKRKRMIGHKTSKLSLSYSFLLKKEERKRVLVRAFSLRKLARFLVSLLL